MNNQTHTPTVQDATNFKEFFLLHDGLENISKEIVFSVFRRYKCKAGCKICYLQNHWIADDQFGPHVPEQMSPEVEATILKFFSWFTTVSTIDDLYLLKTKHPHLFEFYKKHGHLISSSSMTDTAFIQQYDILMKDVEFRSIYEISFSDVFLNKKNGTLVDDIIEKLGALVQRTPILKLKVIICTADGETSTPVKKLVEFARKYDISVGLHDDIIQGRNKKLRVDNVDYQELNFYAQDSMPILVLSEVVFLQYTSVFLTLNDATTTEIAPYYDIVTDGVDDVDHFIRDTLIAKIEAYGRFTTMIEQRCNNKLFDYFAFVSSSVNVDRNFNFIPKVILKPWTEIYKRLREQGWIDTQYGLIDSTCADQVKPLFTISATPKLKIYHIPIKTVLVESPV